jgi:hypothetical protein
VTPTSSCLDGETLAAWVDGGLSRHDAAMADAHVSSCPRCQEIAGLIVKTTPPAVVEVPWWRRRAAWLIPATVGVTAAGLLMIAPADPTPGTAPPTATVVSPSVETKQTEARPSAPPVAPPAIAPPAEQAAAQTKVADAKKERKRDVSGNTAADAFTDRVTAPSAVTPPAATPSPAPPSAATAQAAAPSAATAAERLAKEQSRQKSVAAEPLARQSAMAAGARAAVSPDGMLHWRITDRGALERSADRGTTWQTVDVGAAATFISVQAPEPRTAVVTTADGRVFRTSDGGVTWRPVAPKL